MISILYNKDDFEAASIAMRVQSLAQNAASKIYIVPKHYGRNQAVVYSNLGKTEYAIFLAHDVNETDGETLNELIELKKKNVPIQFVLPIGYEIDEKKLSASDSINYYHSGNQNQIISDLASTITNLSNKQSHARQVPRGRTANNDAVAIGIIAGLALLLLALAASENKNA